MTSPLATAYVAIVPTAKGITGDLTRQLTPGASQAGDQAGHKAGSAFASAFASAAKAGAAGVAAGIAGLATAGIKGAAALEQTQVAFTSLLGSSQAAQTQVAALQKFAAATPFSQQDVLGYAQQFYAFANAAGMAKDQVIPFLTTVGNIGAVTGASTEGIHNAVMAIGQMAGAGKITLDNLNQISDAFPGFNAAAAIAAGTGKSTAEVMSEISAGTIDAKTGIAALITGMQQFQGASGAMAAQATTLNGLFSTFKDTISISLTQAFQPLVPTIKSTLDQLTPAIQSSLNQVAPQIVAIFQALAPALGPVLEQLTQALVPVLRSVADAFTQLAPQLPALAHAFGELLTGVVPVVSALAGVLSNIGPLVSLFGTVAPAILPAMVAMKLFSGAILVTTRALGMLGATRALTAMQGSLASIKATAGFAAVGLGLVAAAWQINSRRAAEAKARAQEYFQALQQSDGMIDGQIQKMVVQKLATEGVYDAATKYGLSLSDVTQAAMGNRDAMQRLAVATHGNYDAFVSVLVPIGQQVEAMQNAQRQYQQASGQLGGLTAAARDAAAAMGALAQSAIGDLGAVDISGLIDQLGVAAGQALGLANNLGAAVGAAIDLSSVGGGALGAIGGVGAGGAVGTVNRIDFLNPDPKKKPKPPAPPPFDTSTLNGFLQTATGSQTNPLTAALNSIFASAKAAGKHLSDGLVSSLRAQNQDLIGLTRQRDQVAEQLQKAQDKLASLKDEVSNVRSTTLGTFDVANIDTKFNEPVTFGTIMRRIRDAVKNAGQFKSILGKLSREGLAPALIQQLAEAGPGALAEAKALASATPKQIGALNRQYRLLGQAGTGIGNIAADQMYQGGVQAAQGLVNGLKSQESALTDAIRSLAQSMVATLRSTLGIHSPSRVARGIGNHMGEGLAIGIADMHKTVAAEADRLANSAVSTAQFGTSYNGRGGRGGSFEFHQHIHNPMVPTQGPSTVAAMRAASDVLR